MRFSRIPAVVVTLVALVCFAGTARANEVLAGHDLFSTPPGGAVEDIGGFNTPDPGDDTPPLPADFFGPGSDPFVGQIDFVGAPLGTFLTQPTGNADTIVERLSSTTLLGTPPNQETIPIELVALSLTSVAPITVTYNGGLDPELWDLDVILSGSAQSLGTMTIVHDQADPGGGTYSASIAVCPLLIFVRQSDLQVEFLDYCPLVDPGGQTIAITGQAWVHDAVLPLESPLSGPNFFIVGTAEHSGPHPVAEPIETPQPPAVPAAGMWALIVLSLVLLTALGIGLSRRRTA